MISVIQGSQHPHLHQQQDGRLYYGAVGMNSDDTNQHLVHDEQEIEFKQQLDENPQASDNDQAPVFVITADEEAEQQPQQEQQQQQNLSIEVEEIPVQMVQPRRKRSSRVYQFTDRDIKRYQNARKEGRLRFPDFFMYHIQRPTDEVQREARMEKQMYETQALQMVENIVLNGQCESSYSARSCASSVDDANNAFDELPVEFAAVRKMSHPSASHSEAGKPKNNNNNIMMNIVNEVIAHRDDDIEHGAMDKLHPCSPSDKYVAHIGERSNVGTKIASVCSGVLIGTGCIIGLTMGTGLPIVAGVFVGIAAGVISWGSVHCVQYVRLRNDASVPVPSKSSPNLAA